MLFIVLDILVVLLMNTRFVLYSFVVCNTCSYVIYSDVSSWTFTFRIIRCLFYVIHFMPFVDTFKFLSTTGNNNIYIPFLFSVIKSTLSANHIIFWPHFKTCNALNVFQNLVHTALSNTEFYTAATLNSRTLKILYLYI